MQFAILGPLEVRRDGRPVALGGGKPRAVLAMLLLHANQPVAAERLAVGLWGEEAPEQRLRTLQVHVSRLRRALGEDDVLTREAAGYRLRVREGELDADRFARLVEDGRRALSKGQPHAAAATLREALTLWRGPPLADLAFEAFAQAEITSLEEQRVAALEDRIDADLEAAREADALIGELRALVAQYPLRERLHGQLMRALYRAGRQADALEVYRRARAILTEELGLEPSPALRELEQAVLRQDAELASTSAAAGAIDVPVPPTEMLGRATELAALSAALATHRLVTVTGPGGVGKTRLAVGVARAMAQQFADGATFVALAALERDEDVAAAVAHRLDISASSGERIEDALARALSDRELLLVLDNFEHVLEAAGWLAELLAAAAGVTVLVTSREPLRLRAERVFVLDPLVPETFGATLFAAVAEARDPRLSPSAGDRPTVVEICRRLDGLPLAIELAAAGLEQMSLRELAAQLRAGLPALGPAPRDMPHRQRTLEATIEWSHGLLSDDEQDAFAALSVFAGGSTMAAAAAVTSAAPAVLGALVRKSLVRSTDGRLQMLETVRGFARAQLACRPDAAVVHERHAEYFAAFAVERRDVLAQRGSLRPFTEVDRELENIRTAMRWALDRPAAAVALTLASALRHYWLVQRLADEGQRWLGAALALPAQDVAPGVRAAALEAYASAVKEDPRRIADAEAAVTEALALRRTLGDPPAVAQAAAQLASISMHAGRAEEAFRRAGEALELAREAGDQPQQTACLAIMAKTAPSMPEALAFADEVAVAYRERGNGWDLVALKVSLVYTALHHDDAALAERLAVDGLRAARAYGDLGLVTLALDNTALAAVFAEHTDRALDPLIEALELERDQHDWRSLSVTLGVASVIAAARRRDLAAAALAGAAAATAPIPHEPSVAARLEARFFAPARARLGETAWRAEYARGKGLDRRGALETALDAADRTAP